MSRREAAEAILASRGRLPVPDPKALAGRDEAAEGGCGVVGLASGEAVAGEHLLPALVQMRNRGNGKGGGVAAAGLVPEELGVSRQVLDTDYLLAVAYLDPAVRPEVEARDIAPTFDVDHARPVPHRSGSDGTGVSVSPPEVWQYFVRVRPDAVAAFAAQAGLDPTEPTCADEVVFQNSYRLNTRHYATAGEKRAFVLSHGRNIMVWKMVGYADDVVRHYRLEDVRAKVWIGHHRYPTKGTVWHPGGAHPFVGLHEALVHNGDFANYASMCTFLAQRNIHPLYVTDTEVAVQLFDLLHRVYGYPLEYVIEAMAPTTERDFARLPADRRAVYRRLQTAHVNGSPDGPWFFLIAQALRASAPGGRGLQRLIGITDTSMLRPQVFALQEGDGVAVGLAASEKQAVDATLESLAAADGRFWGRADRYWNARGGSYTDGGAFTFTVTDGDGRVRCTDKFGREVVVGAPAVAVNGHRPAVGAGSNGRTRQGSQGQFEDPGRNGHWPANVIGAAEAARGYLRRTEEQSRGGGADRAAALEALATILDGRRRWPGLPSSRFLAMADESLGRVADGVRRRPCEAFCHHAAETDAAPGDPGRTLVIDARGFPIDGPRSLARELVDLKERGWSRFVVVAARGHRFLGCGFGPGASTVRLEVYGSPGDYLASGIDGVDVVVHGDGQDQLAQIMKDGRLVIHGDVGQTFLYAAKGGRAFLRGSAGGRALINAVGHPRVVLNGTCLDYLAESFMAGDPHRGGGFVVMNGLRVNDAGEWVDIDPPFAGGNLFSLPSGGCIFVRDPRGRLDAGQLNGGSFESVTPADWRLLEPLLRENEALFGITVERLLSHDGAARSPELVYRKVVPAAGRALQAEEAWVAHDRRR